MYEEAGVRDGVINAFLLLSKDFAERLAKGEKYQVFANESSESTPSPFSSRTFPGLLPLQRSSTRGSSGAELWLKGRHV